MLGVGDTVGVLSTAGGTVSVGGTSGGGSSGVKLGRGVLLGSAVNVVVNVATTTPRVVVGVDWLATMMGGGVVQ